MFAERVLAHYRRAGWKVEPVAGPGWGKATPDFLARKGPRILAILVRGEEPPGPFLVGEFGAQCKRRKMTGVVVAPDDPVVVELCERAGVDFLPGESIGEIAVLGASPEPEARPLPPVAAPAPVRGVPVAEPRPIAIPWWRWAIVAAIWTLAALIITYDLEKLAG